MRFVTLMFLFVIAGLLSCDNANVDNPYDEIVEQPVDSTGLFQLDSYSIAGIHKLILEPKCAIPSCHGGTFEPDYRTPASSWNTMVNQYVIKNNEAYEFRHRVVPYDTTASWLHERLTTDDELLGRMPRYQAPLNAAEMHMINRWILEGCKDIYGMSAVETDENISFYGIGCFNLAQESFHDNRTKWAAPFTAPADQTLYLAMYAWDEGTESPEFLDLKISFSTDPYFFSNPVHLTNFTFNNDNWVWFTTLEPGLLPTGQQIYYRFSGRDDTHNSVMTFPTQQAADYYLDHHSFILQ
jgi:hypothetical protein